MVLFAINKRTAHGVWHSRRYNNHFILSYCVGTHTPGPGVGTTKTAITKRDPVMDAGSSH